METKEINHGMADMTVTVGAVCINVLSMTFLISGAIWCISRVLEAMFGIALIPAR